MPFESIPNFDQYVFVSVGLFIIGLISAFTYASFAPRENSNSPAYSRGNVKDFIEFANGEVLIKDYFVATVKEPSYGEAHFAVTNRRLIMYVWSEKTVQVNNALLKDVRNTDIFWSKRQRRNLGISLFLSGIFLSVIFILPWIYYFQIQQPNFILFSIFLLTIPMIIIGLYYMKKIRNILVIIINVKAATGAFTYYSYPKTSIFGGQWNPEKLELDALPGPDARLMAQEVGGLLLNLQKDLEYEQD
jgi:hypothetical protein